MKTKDYGLAFPLIMLLVALIGYLAYGDDKLTVYDVSSNGKSYTVVSEFDVKFGDSVSVNLEDSEISGIGGNYVVDSIYKIDR